MTGRNARSITPDSDVQALTIAKRCAEVFAANGWRGPMNIQCQPDASGRLMIHEFNARFTGATAARRLLGHDEVGIALAAYTGRCFDEPSAPDASLAKEGLVPRSASREEVKFLTQHRTWQREPR